MGWKERDWYLGDHGAALFDRNGNAGPTIWADGRVIGGWVQRTDGTIATKLLERVDRPTNARLERDAERLAAWLGEVRIIPRFRTPVDQELTTAGGASRISGTSSTAPTKNPTAPMNVPRLATGMFAISPVSGLM